MALQDKYINPFTDYGFKKLFGTEINKDLLIDLETISKITGKSIEAIKNILKEAGALDI